MIKDTQIGGCGSSSWGVHPYWVMGCTLGVKLSSMGAQRQVEGGEEESGSERQEDMSSWGRKSF